MKESLNTKKRLPYTFKVGDQVRITHLRRTFQCDYYQTYTEEVFVIRDRFVSQGIPIYKSKGLTDDPIQGTFYASEIQKVFKKKRQFAELTRFYAGAKFTAKKRYW